MAETTHAQHVQQLIELATQCMERFIRASDEAKTGGRASMITFGIAWAEAKYTVIGAMHTEFDDARFAKLKSAEAGMSSPALREAYGRFLDVEDSRPDSSAEGVCARLDRVIELLQADVTPVRGKEGEITSARRATPTRALNAAAIKWDTLKREHFQSLGGRRYLAAITLGGQFAALLHDVGAGEIYEPIEQRE